MDRVKNPCVLLMAYGAARSPEEIPAFLADVRGGRPPSESLIREFVERLRLVGGASPFHRITGAQAEALAARLAAAGGSLPVYVGMLHSEPRIAEAAARIAAAGHDAVIAMSLTPYDSGKVVDGYFERLDQALAGTGRPLRTERIRSWHDQPGLLEAYAASIRDAASRLPAAEREGTALLLTAHSMPQSWVSAGCPYPAQVAAAARGAAERAGFSRHTLAYQSRPDGVRDPWLGPEAAEELRLLAGTGVRSVLVAPIGFVSEHMETLYDLDVLLQGEAAGLGLRFTRAATPNASAPLIAAMAEVVLGRLAA